MTVVVPDQEIAQTHADAGSGDTCSPAYMDFVSSRGLSLRLQH